MGGDEIKFELPRNIEHYLAALSKVCAREGHKQIQEIIVNSQIRVHEGYSYDGWDGGTHGHAIYLTVPEALYLSVVEQRNDYQVQIRDGINKIHNIPNEFIEQVFLEMEIATEHDWRKQSGLLLTGKRIVLPDAENRIWGDNGYRVFLSHIAEVKKDTAALKKELELFGISCFVAHEDIRPTKEWQSEIEIALSSMDALVALLTDKFHDSFWTDQEVGFAFGRGVPILSVKLGMNPYGFIGKFQALSCSWNKAALEIVKILVKHDQMLNAYIKAVQNCTSFDHGNSLAKVLPSLQNLSDQQVSLLISAYHENGQLRGSFGFSGGNRRHYGDGLASHLSRLTGQNYRVSSSGDEIELRRSSPR